MTIDQRLPMSICRPIERAIRHSPIVIQLLRCLLVFTSTLSITAAEPPAAKPTFHSSLKLASEAAAADQSLVLLIFSAEWCGPCKALKKNTLDSKEFLEGGGALRVTDVDIDADQKTARAFTVNAVPTLVLLTADSKIVSRHTGYLAAADLMTWVEEGRRRAKACQWEGTAPGTKLDQFVTKAAGDGLEPNDLKRLVAMLGEPDPAERAGVAKLLLAQREQAVPALIEAASDPYLGVRIAASELLQRLAPDVPFLDPWQSPAELTNHLVALKKWWTDTGKLPPASAPRAMDPTVEGSIKTALEALHDGDALRRTEAMSTLVGHGAPVLPAVREAIKRSERTDPRAVVLLEDVRWAVLISDAVEKRTGGVRNTLARGTGPERQAAVTRLGHAGREAVEALSELANDTDPLVVESAVRALSSVGGKDVIPAMAALLKAADSNLRMTAAQALGRTKSADATKHLLTVLNDPNEVVACAALAALDEVNSKDSPFNPSPGAKDALDAQTVAALKTALGDPRWRVRAAAAEVVGKLKVTDAVTDLKKLVDDADGFVVKNALVALSGLSAAPDTEQLTKLARRMPALQGEAVAMLARSGSDETVKAITEMYDAASTEGRVTILNGLARRERFETRPVDDTWKPLLKKAMSSPEARLRRAAAGLVGLASPGLAAEMIGPLLADEDGETRATAAEIVLGVLAGRKSGALRGAAIYNGIEIDTDEVSYVNGVRTTVTKTNKTFATIERLAAWHSNLLQRAGEAPAASVATAVFATGDGTSDLPLLATALEKADAKSVQRLAASGAMGVIVPKLSWPEAKAVLEKVCVSPWLFVLAVAENEKARPEVAGYLLEPGRFRAAVESAAGDDLASVLQRLLYDYQVGNRRPWSLLTPGERTRQIVSALLDSTNAAWRAAAVYVLARRDAEKNAAVFEKALKDASPWVRAAAVQGMARAAKDRATLEERLGPMLADSHPRVTEVAAMALLEPEVRAISGLQWQFNYFQFETMQAGSSESVTMNEERPLTVLENKPAFLERARRRLAGTNEFERLTMALLLAQYGEFDGVDRLAAQRSERTAEKHPTLSDPLLTGIALSRDAKYVPFLRRLMEQTPQDYELRKILRALKGMTGAEARQLRLEVNKRTRTAGANISFE